MTRKIRVIGIRKEKVKLSLFANDMIYFLEWNNDGWKIKLNQTIKEFSKEAKYKITIQKINSFLLYQYNKFNHTMLTQFRFITAFKELRQMINIILNQHLTQLVVPISLLFTEYMPAILKQYFMCIPGLSKWMCSG